MTDFLSIDVSSHLEKKQTLTYLSWAWAWTECLKVDPEAHWDLTEYPDANGVQQPCMFLPGGSAMVKVSVTIEGRAKTAVLPVMNPKNQAIQNPDAFQVNTAIMRCLAKAIAMHGLGLSVYAGEDLPSDDARATSRPAKVSNARAGIHETPTPAPQPRQEPQSAAQPAAPVAQSTNGEGYACELCGAELQPVRFRDGTEWTPALLASYGKRKHSQILCMQHYREANEARKNAESTATAAPTTPEKAALDGIKDRLEKDPGQYSAPPTDAMPSEVEKAAYARSIKTAQDLTIDVGQYETTGKETRSDLIALSIRLAAAIDKQREAQPSLV